MLAALVVAGGATAWALAHRVRPVSVRVARVARGRVEETVSSTKAGAIRSRAAASLSVDVAGTVVELPVREGHAAKRGDLLLRVDRRDPEAALASAKWEAKVLEALVREARAQHADAVRERDRLRSAGEAITKLQFEQAQGRVDVREAMVIAAEGRLEQQRAALERAQVAVARCDLRAPFDGVVTERFVELGEWASPGKSVLRLVALERLYVRAEIDEVDLGRLKPDLPARVTLDPWKDRKLPGKLGRIAPYVSEVQDQNRTVEVEVELVDPPADMGLRPGISADVEVVVRDKGEVLRVPTVALTEGDRVLVVGADGIVRARRIQAGVRNWEWAEVAGGLAEGDRVVVSLESEQVKDGVPAVIVQGEPP